MSITSSVVTIEGAQVDGRRWVLEVHSDAQGEVARISYLGPSDAASTAQSVANARAVLLNTSLADAEAVAKCLIDANPLPLRFQTATEFLNRLRAFYRAGKAMQLVRLARWITRRIDDGSATVTQLRTVWGLTLTQWQTLEAKMRALRADIEAVDGATGE